MGSAHWNLEPHNAEAGPVVAMGALGAIPGGLGVVEGGRIPYKPEAAKQRADNKANWLELDPLVKCYLPGVPRATYLPHPFQIVQEPNTLLITYEFAGADRIVYMKRPGTEAQVDSWMGYNLGRWEGDTLVIDVTGQMPETLARQRRQFPWPEHEGAGALHADRCQCTDVRGDDHGPGRLHAAVEDQHAALSPPR